ncbi:uncharacterized protein OCT59_008076 [Rhizophagus irregularis]|uniref:uncharacterized protein n=1 Tax=Rhizophagus irregularis TaxID=588596 RepID=UPI0019E3EF0C|nr:hypothetical protein OCT59_008076 [Rhizophagus irregularis]GBC42847.2 hypothetical protein GLOIN_2v1881079 [Rhizophagus irregularis DAOM 181602=DAOM 197198]
MGLRIVTDVEKWYFVECIQDSERKLSFKLLKSLFVAYENTGMKDMAEKVLDQIIWLLEESQKVDLGVIANKERNKKGKVIEWTVDTRNNIHSIPQNCGKVRQCWHESFSDQCLPKSCIT